MFWRTENFSLSTTWQAATLRAAKQLLIQRASKYTQQTSRLDGKYSSPGKQPPSKKHFLKNHKKPKIKQKKMFKTLNTARFCP